MSGLVTSAQVSLKCRKCRHLLLEQPPHQILEHTADASDINQEASNTIIICDDNLPQWISDAIEEGSWTRGKLLCPGCSARLGGFDYVSRAGEPVYLVKSKVDIKQSGSGLEALRPESTDQSSAASQDTSSGDDDDIEDKEDNEDESEEEESDESNTESDHADASRESSSSDDDIMLHRQERNQEKMRRRKRKKEMMIKKRQRDKKMKQQDMMKELLEGEPELAEISDDLICPVCLDLLHEPFQVDPCGHIFCEPCLRRLGQKNPMNCTCPLCRTKIFFCKHQTQMAREIREQQQQLYMKRKKFERSTPVFQYPLPWQPGWRNLLRGRPLGGNNLLRDNRVDWVRTILHQVPYYIPPVIIANIINIGIFAFMMGFIEIFPNLLALVLGTSKNMSLILNTTDAETSGDTAAVESSMTELDGDIVDVDDDPAAGSVEAFDVTLAWAVFVSSLVVAGVGQIFMHLEQNGWNGAIDTHLFMLVIILPFTLIIPLVLPWRNGDGSWLMVLIEKLTSFFFNHMNYYTAILLCFTVWFVYHVDINDDLLW